MIILSLFALSIFIGIILGFIFITPIQIDKKPNIFDVYLDDNGVCYKYKKKYITSN